jgi:raffinose/stachyose/melibiose transport system permease protein
MKVTQSRTATALAAGAALVWLVPLAHLLQVSADGGLGNYTAVISERGLARNLLNSAIVSVATIAIVVGVASPAAFAFSKLRFPGRSLTFVLLLAGLMLPTAVVLVPLAQIENSLGWPDTYQALFVPYAALAAPFALVLLKAAYDSLPDELMEAAAIDGASLWTIFRRVLAPLTMPTVLVVVLWTFLSAWNEFLLALLFLRDPAMQTVPVVPLQFRLQFFVDVPKVFAALVLIELPAIALYLAFQRRFERGLLGGVIR